MGLDEHCIHLQDKGGRGARRGASSRAQPSSPKPGPPGAVRLVPGQHCRGLRGKFATGPYPQIASFPLMPVECVALGTGKQHCLDSILPGFHLLFIPVLLPFLVAVSRMSRISVTWSSDAPILWRDSCSTSPSQRPSLCRGTACGLSATCVAGSPSRSRRSLPLRFRSCRRFFPARTPRYVWLDYLVFLH